MKNNQHQIQQAVKALKAAANGISSSIEDETVSADEVHALLITIADSIESLSNTTLSTIHK